jgi:hypothetical protein
LHRDRFAIHDRGCKVLTVKECVPFFLLFSHRPALRAARVASFTEALSLSWITRLPGEKRIRFYHGQVFVVQRYLGFQLIRAQICHAQDGSGDPPIGKASSCDHFVSATSDHIVAGTN